VTWDAAFFARLDRLTRPRSVAVVGASPNPSFVSSIFRNVVELGFEGNAYPINPRHAEVAGRPSYPSLRAVPEPVDHVVVGVPGRLLPQILDDAEANGAGCLVIVSAGFAELAGEDGARRQRELRDWSTRTGIRVVGPNCLGMLSTPGKLRALYGWYAPIVPGPIAVVLHSGQMASSVATPLSDRGIGFSYIVTSGNEADLEATDFVRYFVEDPGVKVIGAFLEQLRSPERLVEVAELAAERGKPIVVLKLGRSEGAVRAARAHTGSLVGSDRAVDAVFRRHGIQRVGSIDEMFEALAIFHAPRRPKGDGVGLIFVSGGASGMAHDLAGETGIRLPPLDEATAARLAGVVPEYGSVGNPLDITGQGVFDQPILEGAVAALAEAPGIDTIAYGRGFPARLDRQGIVGRVFSEAVEKYPEKLFLIFSLVGGRMFPEPAPTPPMVEPISAIGGVPFLQDSAYTYRAIAALNRYAAFQRRRAAGPAARLTEDAARTRARAYLEAIWAGPSGGEPAGAGRGRDGRAGRGRRPLTEREGKHVLALYGIPIPREALATSADGAVAAAQTLGFPVALKIESPDITHKTEVGGVRIGLADAGAVRDAFEGIVAAAGAHRPDAAIQGVLVQQMVEGGVEVILGMARDPDFGPTVAVGLGGVLVELLDDVQLRLPPLGVDEAREMLDALRGRRLLDGQRGRPPLDVGAAVEAIVRFGELAADLGDLVAEIDVNPLVVLPQGVCALDCLIVPRDEEEP
jgi:acyl-CoA synthetase (NDP forming)